MITVKILKSCRNDPIDRSILTQFYNANQIDDYLYLQQCRSIDSSWQQVLYNDLFLARHPQFASTTLATILAYSLIIAFLVFLLVFCTAMSLFCLYRMTTVKTMKSDK
jgi:hypothetical protein